MSTVSLENSERVPVGRSLITSVLNLDPSGRGLRYVVDWVYPDLHLYCCHRIRRLPTGLPGPQHFLRTTRRGVVVTLHTLPLFPSLSRERETRENETERKWDKVKRSENNPGPEVCTDLTTTPRLSWGCRGDYAGCYVVCVGVSGFVRKTTFGKKVARRVLSTEIPTGPNGVHKRKS